MSVKLFYFINGLELIGDYTPESLLTESGQESYSPTLRIVKPAQIMSRQTPNGVNVMLGKFLPLSSEEEFDFQVSSILTIAEPNTEILNSYNEMFGSGIVVPNSGLIEP